MIRFAKLGASLFALLTLSTLSALAFWQSRALPDQVQTQTIAPGLMLSTIIGQRPFGALQLLVVRATPGNGWRLQVALPGGNVMQRETVSSIAARQKSAIAINGGYFAYDGAAIGPLRLNGEWIRLPWSNRTTLGIDAAGKIKIDNLSAKSRVNFGDGSHLDVGTLNGTPGAGNVMLLTPRFGTAYTLGANEAALTVDNGVVSAKTETGIAPIPVTGFLIVARGDGRAQLTAPIGQSATFQIEMTHPDWKNYPTIVGAGPRLLRDGNVQTTEVEEKFRPDVTRPGPRTALGLDAQGNIVLVIAVGWNQTYQGLTIPQLALEMEALGIRDGMSLDGGGSTDLVVNNRIIYKSVPDREVPVANAVMITKAP